MSVMQGLRLAAVGIAAATCVLLVVGVLQLLGFVDTVNEIPLWIVPFILAALLVPTAVGLVIALRQPRNVIAWILLVGAFAIVAFSGPDLFFSDGWSLQVGRATWPLLYAWPIAVTYVFPDGRFLSFAGHWYEYRDHWVDVGWKAPGVVGKPGAGNGSSSPIT